MLDRVAYLLKENTFLGSWLRVVVLYT